MRYLISYDLDKPGQNYLAITSQLESVGARRVLFSQWVVRWPNATAATIRAWLWSFMDANDRLLVVSLDSDDWAGMNLMVDPNAL